MRPSNVDFPLLVHVLGATVLVGALVLALMMLTAARNGGDALLGVRLGYRTLLLAALPSYIVMRVGAEWVASEGDWSDDLDFISIGYMTADGGLLLLIIATVLTGVATRRASAGTGVRVATGLIALTILAYGVAIWAMTTKPV